MKQLLFILALFICSNVFAQSGVYVNEPKNSDGTKIKWTLTLDEDRTFIYHFLRDLSAISKANTEENYYAEGTWKTDGNIVVLNTNAANDLNGQYTLNLNNSKARYITKSTRDKSDRVVKTALSFYESETFHIKGLELFKID